MPQKGIFRFRPFSENLTKKLRCFGACKFEDYFFSVSILFSNIELIHIITNGIREGARVCIIFEVEPAGQKIWSKEGLHIDLS